MEPSKDASLQPCILIVDDDPQGLRLLHSTLTGLARIVFAKTGEEALDLALAEVLSVLPIGIDAIAVAGPAAEVAPADIDALVQSLSEDDMKALTQFDPLRAGLLAAHGEPAVRALSETIDTFDFAAAASVLRSWYPQ